MAKSRTTSVSAALLASALVTSAHAATIPPLKRVSLSSAGVGYFEHEAQVSGPTTLTLSIPRDQIDDVLKSLTIDGANGGAVSVRLPGSEPLSKSFRDFSFSPEALQSPVRLLNELRGAVVSIEGPRQIRGKLMSIESEVVNLDNDRGTMTRYRISIITDQGLEQVVLNDVQSLRFEDEKLRDQLSRALDTVASTYENGPRLVDIVLSGEGARTVRLGYVVATPIWKVAYRVRLGTDDKARLQGWAILENTSGRDWEGVELTLLSGNPVSFRQPLYQAYYTDRPIVPVETPNQLLPVIDQGEMAKLRQMADRRPAPAQSRMRIAEANASNATAQWSADAMMAEEREMGQYAPEPSAPPPTVAATENQSQIVLRLPEAQTIASGQSMMVPIVDQEIAAVRHTMLEGVKPVVAVEIANNGSTGLPPGAITFYDDAGSSSYLGDGRIGALPSGEKRLVAFASDLNVRVMRDPPTSTTQYSATIANGSVEMKNRIIQTTTYRMKSSAPEKRIVTIDYPRNSGETLVSPKEGDGNVTLILNGYRIRHPLAAGAEEKLDIVTERVTWERLGFDTLQRLDRDNLAYYHHTIVQNGAIDAETRKIFQDIADIRKDAIEAQEIIESLQETRELILSEQDRLRQNLGRVPSGSDLGKRYLKQMTEQEDKMEAILSQIEDQNARKAKSDAALRQYLNDMSRQSAE